MQSIFVYSDGNDSLIALNSRFHFCFPKISIMNRTIKNSNHQLNLRLSKSEQSKHERKTEWQS